MRPLIIKAHLWLGLTVGVLWALQGLTGAALVFQRELSRLARPAASAGPMASIDAMLANSRCGSAARVSVADARRDTIHVLCDPGDPPGRTRVVVLDAASAQPVDTLENNPKTPFTGAALRWVFLLHTALLQGTAGEILIGASGLLLFTSTLAGLWFAWPRRAAWRAAFSFRKWATPRQKLYGWHRALGLTAGAVLLMIALSGAYMSLDHWIDPLIGLGPRHPSLPAHAEDSQRVQRLSPQQALTLALKRFPDAQWVRLYMPTPQTPRYRIQMRRPGEHRAWFGATSVSVHPANGQIVHVYDALDSPLADRLIDAAYPLHNGEIAGLPGRLAVLLSGGLLSVMFATGLASWLGKRRRRALAAREDFMSEPDSRRSHR